MNQHLDPTVWQAPADHVDSAVEELLQASGLYQRLATETRVLLKPNLVEALSPPITTPAPLIKAIAESLLNNCPQVEVSIAEGTGSLQYDTFHCYRELGYDTIAEKLPVSLVDLNCEPCRRLTDESCKRWPEMYLPELIFDSFLISVPVLKAHSLSGVTLTMKNMMGCAPPAHYQQGGGWGKAAFHTRIQEAVFDLNRYRTPDFTILDASVGMARAHLWGPTCSPPVNRLAVSHDPVAIDAQGCRLLGRNWRDIDHISRANQVLGQAEPLSIKKLALA